MPDATKAPQQLPPLPTKPATAAVWVRVLREIRYGGKTRLPGAEFAMPAHHARLLAAVGKVVKVDALADGGAAALSITPQGHVIVDPAAGGAVGAPAVRRVRKGRAAPDATAAGDGAAEERDVSAGEPGHYGRRDLQPGAGAGGSYRRRDLQAGAPAAPTERRDLLDGDAPAEGAAAQPADERDRDDDEAAARPEA